MSLSYKLILTSSIVWELHEKIFIVSTIQVNSYINCCLKKSINHLNAGAHTFFCRTMYNGLMEKMNLKGKKLICIWWHNTLPHYCWKVSFHVVIVNNAWYNTMKIWKEVFHSFSKEIVWHLNQISGGLGSWLV